MGKWIAVTDRLPKEKINPLTMDLQNVICFCDFGGDSDQKRTDVRVYPYGTPIGHKEAHFWHGPQQMDGVVTHWMPLPESPNEENIRQRDIKQGLRPCSVDGRAALFHRWADVARTLPPSSMVGGNPGGQFWSVVGIVEMEDGRVEEVSASKIVFEDKNVSESKE